jgi:hypothetical protein
MIDKINNELFGISEKIYMKRYWELENDKNKQDELVKEVIKADKKREIAMYLFLWPLIILLKIYMWNKGI